MTKKGQNMSVIVALDVFYYYYFFHSILILIHFLFYIKVFKLRYKWQGEKQKATSMEEEVLGEFF